MFLYKINSALALKLKPLILFCILLLSGEILLTAEAWAQDAKMSIPANFSGKTHLFAFSAPNNTEQVLWALDQKKLYCYRINLQKNILIGETNFNNEDLKMGHWSFVPLSRFQNKTCTFVLHSRETPRGKSLILSWVAKDFKTSGHKIQELPDNEEFIKALAAPEGIYALTYLPKSQTLRMRVFSNEQEPQIKDFVLKEKELINVLNNHKAHYFSEVPILFEPRLDHVYSAIKCYPQSQNLILSIEKADATYVYELPSAPQIPLKKRMIARNYASKRANSFLKDNLLFSVTETKNNLVLTISELNTQKKVHEMSYAFGVFPRNGIGLQDGGRFSPYRRRYLESNTQVARKLQKGRLSLAITSYNQGFRLAIGSFQRFKGNRGLVIVPELAGSYTESPAQGLGLGYLFNNLLHFSNTGDQECVASFRTWLSAKDYSFIDNLDDAPSDAEKMASYVQYTNAQRFVAACHLSRSLGMWQYSKASRSLVLIGF
ncbi:MAG: hypothetical protein EAZ57_08585 [Cytophagales bacterium]|nr:MAG: hypothetical protein EAZ67_09395 [Cytophagales bacterium]TAF60083.1 MAG: hypothetical protein EAZ57_08585 [Cytophagales bacterium]